jgi:hypothetical protein
MAVVEYPRRFKANYGILLDSWEYVRPENLIGLRNACVGIDEAYHWLESRTSSKNINRWLSYIQFQSRKVDVDYLISAQLVSTVDLRWREMADYVVKCQSLGDWFVYTMFHVLDADHVTRKVFTVRKKEMWELVGPFYDTTEIVDPLDADLLEDVTTDRRSLLPAVDEATEDLAKIAPFARWTRAAIDDYCLRIGKGDTFAGMLYNAVKRKSLI